MPELPEVEVTRRKLAPFLVDRVIEQAITTVPSYVFLTPPDVLAARLRGAQVRGLLRRGKYLIAELSGGARLLLHLGMTGQLFAEGCAGPPFLRHTGRGTVSSEVQRRGFVPDSHTHLWLRLSGSKGDVFFRDARKFGKIQWLEQGVPCARVDKLGVDALAADGDVLYRGVRNRRVAIKTVLLDQRVLAGIGNIYADEGLHGAGISPLRQACKLNRARCATLVQALQAVLVRAIESGGSSMRDYVHPDGQRGGFLAERRVYGLTGAPCFACGRAIARVVIGGRASHYCPRCQR